MTVGPDASPPDRTPDDGALVEALGLAYRYLARHDRTVIEMRKHLRARGVAPEVVELCVGELGEQGYLDDVRFAQRYSEDRRTLDGWGVERIAARLGALGIEPDLIEATMGAFTRRDELATALEVLQRRLRAAPANDGERQRALGLLVRRGYDLELAYDAVRRFEQDAA